MSSSLVLFAKFLSKWQSSHIPFPYFCHCTIIYKKVISWWSVNLAQKMFLYQRIAITKSILKLLGARKSSLRFGSQACSNKI